jgi:hypothetical protein
MASSIKFFQRFRFVQDRSFVYRSAKCPVSHVSNRVRTDILVPSPPRLFLFQ